MLPYINVIFRDLQRHIDLLHISEAYADRKKKIDSVMKKESKPFITAVQKAFLSNEESITIQSSKHMGPLGNRDRRFDNLKKIFDDDPLDGKDGYTHSWSSLAVTSNGGQIVVLDYQGKSRWYNVFKTTENEDAELTLPAAKLRIEEAYPVNNFNVQDDTLDCNQTSFKGIEISENSNGTFQLVLMKSRENFQISKVLHTPEDNSRTTQMVTNIRKQKSDLLDGCVLSNGISNTYHSFAMIDSLGKIYINDLNRLEESSPNKCIASLEDCDAPSPENYEYRWASLNASSTGDYLFATTRKFIRLYDLRSRPQYEGNCLKLFSIPLNRDIESSSEMIGGVTNSHVSSEGLMYFCSNLRIGAIDKRMPGRVYSQIQLHNNPSLSKKVVVPSGITSFSAMCPSNDNQSRLDYLAAWMPYSNTSRINHPTAIVTCFNQSYNFCGCNSNAIRNLPLSLEECQNHDHSNISQAPLVVRGKPLRIAGPLSCIDFSNQEMTNRLSLPCTGFIMAKLQESHRTRSSDLSVISANIAGDIFMTDLSEYNQKIDNEFASSPKSNNYNWKNINFKSTNLSDRIEQLSEEFVNKWWYNESSVSDQSSNNSNQFSEVRFGHLKRANFIFNLKPNAYLNSNIKRKKSNKSQTIDEEIEHIKNIKNMKSVTVNNTNISIPVENLKDIFIESTDRKKNFEFTKEYKLAVQVAGRLDSLGRINFSKELKILQDHAETQNMLEIMSKLKPNVDLNSSSDIEQKATASEGIMVKIKGKSTLIPKDIVNGVLVESNTSGQCVSFTKEYKLAAIAAGRGTSSGRFSSTKELKLLKLQATKRKKQEVFEKVRNRRKMRRPDEQIKKDSLRHREWKDNMKEYCPTASRYGQFSESCPSLKVINPHNYTGEQGIRANEQISDTQQNVTPRISRINYYDITKSHIQTGH